MFAVRTDESDAAERVTETALDIAEKYTADVRTVHVAGSTTYDFEDAPEVSSDCSRRVAVTRRRLSRRWRAIGNSTCGRTFILVSRCDRLVPARCWGARQPGSFADRQFPS